MSGTGGSPPSQCPAHILTALEREGPLNLTDLLQHIPHKDRTTQKHLKQLRIDGLVEAVVVDGNQKRVVYRKVIP